MTSRAQLAIVIVTRNRCASLERTLTQLQALPDACQIVVVDNASTDATAETVRRHGAAIAFIQLNENIGAAGRNLGVRLVEQPYIAFCDDDSWWAAGALSQGVALFERHERLAVLMSRILVGPQQRLDPCCALMRASPLPRSGTLPGIPILGFVTCGAMVRRAAFLRAGGFHERFGIGGEEALLAIDLAEQRWGLRYMDTIVSYHDPSPQRNQRRRQVVALRNALWTLWLRRSAADAARGSRNVVKAAGWSHETLLGVTEALCGIPWILQQRRVVSPELVQQLASLEAATGGPTGRSAMFTRR
jgi:GT2 family glycosyltransferase